MSWYIFNPFISILFDFFSKFLTCKTHKLWLTNEKNLPSTSVWGVSKYTPQTYNWHRVELCVWGVSDLTRPKHLVRPRSNYRFGVCQNWVAPLIQVWGRRLNRRLMFLRHLSGGRQLRHVAPDIWMKVLASGPKLSFEYYHPPTVAGLQSPAHPRLLKNSRL